MTTLKLKTCELKRKRVTSRSLRKRSEKLFTFLAVLAVALNFLVPITHSFISNVEAGELLEICTNQGVKIVQVDLSSENTEKMHDAMGEDCQACPDCPLCPIGKTSFLAIPSQDYSWLVFEPAVNEAFFASEHLGSDEPLWSRPALRAPPIVGTV